MFRLIATGEKKPCAAFKNQSRRPAASERKQRGEERNQWRRAFRERDEGLGRHWCGSTQAASRVEDEAQEAREEARLPGQSADGPRASPALRLLGFSVFGVWPPCLGLDRRCNPVFAWSYLVLPGLAWSYLVLPGLAWSCPGLSWSYLVLPGLAISCAKGRI